MNALACIAVVAATAVVPFSLHAATPLAITPVATNLSWPVYVTSPPGDSNRLFIVERSTSTTGYIRILNMATDEILPTNFLAVPNVNAYVEGGLLSMAFHPQYASNGYFYIFYSAFSDGSIPTNNSVVRYKVSSDPNIADATSAVTVLTFVHPNVFHHAGWVGFGPDGYLYLPTGDGGPQTDPNNRAQTITNTWLGKILRVDVNGDDFAGDPERNYRIPPDNPFVNTNGDDEIWAYGLRNPFRCSFDSANGDFWIADVGQYAWEEVNFQPAGAPGGRNYGWHVMEGTNCSPYGGGICNDPSFIPPIFTYAHSNGAVVGFAVIGGYVYRGSLLDGWQGAYFFGESTSNTYYSLRYDGTNITEFTDHTAELRPHPGPYAAVSFGEDAASELYLIDMFGGTVYRIVPEPAALLAMVAFVAATRRVQRL
ncbi:PQQ-dependent sugar dehydrogenase [bacterium]|nr:PQQ-dependent sugar dehydrogenase [bacterium]